MLADVRLWNLKHTKPMGLRSMSSTVCLEGSKLAHGAVALLCRARPTCKRRIPPSITPCSNAYEHFNSMVEKVGRA